MSQKVFAPHSRWKRGRGGQPENAPVGASGEEAGELREQDESLGRVLAGNPGARGRLLAVAGLEGRHGEEADRVHQHEDGKPGKSALRSVAGHRGQG